MIFLKDDKTSQGSKAGEWLILPSTEKNVPHIHLRVPVKGRGFAGTIIYVGAYSMRLKLVPDEKQDKTYHGTVHLSLPDYKRTCDYDTVVATRS